MLRKDRPAELKKALDVGIERKLYKTGLDDIKPEVLLDKLQQYVKERKVTPEEVAKRIWADGRKPTLGTYLRQKRLEMNYSLRGLERALSPWGIDESYLSNVELDKTTPRKKRLQIIGNFLGLDIDFLCLLAYK